MVCSAHLDNLCDFGLHRGREQGKETGKEMGRGRRDASEPQPGRTRGRAGWFVILHTPPTHTNGGAVSTQALFLREG